MKAAAHDPARTVTDPGAAPEPADVRHVIEFAAGVPGFEGCRRFVLMSAPELAPFACLQALDAPRPSFLAVDPRRLDPSYDLTLREFERTRLGASPHDALLWLAIISITPDGSTANLRAPIVICPRRMTGCQFIRDEATYPVDAPLGVG